VPNPFVLAPPWDEGRLITEGGEIGLCLVLIGRAVQHADFARQAVIEAGLRELGPDRSALDLVAVDSVEWARWSGRRQALIRMGGLLGSLSLPLTGRESFWPFLALAPWVHVGKGATIGLGAMRVAPA
jgi:hypothetical protein